MNQRNEQGRFTKNNTVRKKPSMCPYCQEELVVQQYLYLKKKRESDRNKTEVTEHESHT